MLPLIHPSVSRLQHFFVFSTRLGFYSTQRYSCVVLTLSPCVHRTSIYGGKDRTKGQDICYVSPLKQTIGMCYVSLFKSETRPIESLY